MRYITFGIPSPRRFFSKSPAFSSSFVIFIAVTFEQFIQRAFFDQVLGICDSVILEIGSGTTSRAKFGYVRRHVMSVDKPIMAMATGANANVVRTEMEARI